MAGRTSVAWGADLVQRAARLADWRRCREVGARIPAALWELAVKLAERHGVNYPDEFQTIVANRLAHARGLATRGDTVASAMQ